jgi:dihydrofolate synthase/folylpolyglutamate synthase
MHLVELRSKTLKSIFSSHQMNSADPAISSLSVEPGSALADVDTLLNRFTHFGVDLGLERIERLLADLGNPQKQVPIIHVAGSNGKGSVCAYLSSVLTEAGYRVGRYTSPHLVSWCERICLNGQVITPEALRQLLLQVLAAIRPEQPSPTQFEVITAAAWLYFAQQQVDLAVVEVGLGGRLDATNVCDRPLVSVITPLSREHWQRLGPTLADISREKAGILKPVCPAVIAPQPPAAAAVIQQRLAELGCPSVWVAPSRDLGLGWAEFQATEMIQPALKANQSELSNPKNSLSTQCSTEADRSLPVCPYPLVLPGAHQLTNSALAIATLQLLRQQGWAISEKHLIQGMATTQWQGRLHWITWQNQPILVDGAHNPAGAAALRHYLDQDERVTQPIHWVMGMLATKDHADVFRELLRPGDRLDLVPVPDHLSADLETLMSLAQAVCPELKDCQLHADVLTGLNAAMQHDRSTIVLCGSLYLIGHFFKLTAVSNTISI